MGEGADGLTGWFGVVVAGLRRRGGGAAGCVVLRFVLFLFDVVVDVPGVQVDVGLSSSWTRR